MAEQQEKENIRKRISLKDIRNTLRIFRFTLPYKLQFLTGSLFLLLSSVTVLAFPYVTGKLVDSATGENQWLINDINSIALLLVGVLLFQGIFSYWRVIFFARVSEFTMADIRQALYDQIISLPVPFFEKRRVGELISRITSDVTQLQDTISLTLAEFFRQIATLIVGVIIIMVTSTKLALLMLATYPVIIITAVIFGRYIRKLSKKTQDALADANVVVEETLQSIHIVKAFTNEWFESSRFGKSVERVVDYALQAAKFRAAFISFIIFGLFGGIVLVLWYGARLVHQGEITIGELTAFIIYTMFIGGAVGGMGEVYSKIQKTVGASERILEILAEEPEISIQGAFKEPKIKIEGRVDFEDIVFSYPTRNDITVLNHIYFSIQDGEKIALVGPSGAGKSTITQLLIGFYGPDSGAIKIDGLEISQYGLADLRRNIGIVPQDVILFGGTIRENIAYGKPGASEQEILKAAQKANALEFIESFPERLETIVGERGVKLSGGQKQRIAIARAILKDPAILILDEATSSLDAASEVLVQQALEELMKDRTTIVIAHRLSTIRKVDKILVLNHGEIVEAGSHEELIKNEKGLYYHLINLQFDLSEHTFLS